MKRNPTSEEAKFIIEIRRKGLASDRKNNKSVAVYHINYISSDKISPIWNELNDLKP